MKTRILVPILFILTLFGLTSCTTIFTGMYGMKKTKTVDEKTIARFAKKYNVPATDNYELDTAYFSYLFSLDTVTFGLKIEHRCIIFAIFFIFFPFFSGSSADFFGKVARGFYLIMTKSKQNRDLVTWW